MKSAVIQTDFHTRFRAIKLIGEGAFAKVFLVERCFDSKKFAVKAFSKMSLYGNRNGRASLINEIEILRKLDHPNVIKLEEVAESNNSVYLIMKFVGNRFTDLTNKRKISPMRRISIMRQLLEAIVYLRKSGIVHRDLKPDNILIDANNSITIIDFGLATRLNHSTLSIKCGTIGFIAPEVLSQKPNSSLGYGFECDIYSLGVFLFCMAVGRNPFSPGTLKDIYTRNKAGCVNWNFSRRTERQFLTGEHKLMLGMLEVEVKSRISPNLALESEYFQLNEHLGPIRPAIMAVQQRKGLLL